MADEKRPSPRVLWEDDEYRVTASPKALTAGDVRLQDVIDAERD